MLKSKPEPGVEPGYTDGLAAVEYAREAVFTAVLCPFDRVASYEGNGGKKGRVVILCRTRAA